MADDAVHHVENPIRGVDQFGVGRRQPTRTMGPVKETR